MRKIASLVLLALLALSLPLGVQGDTTPTYEQRLRASYDQSRVYVSRLVKVPVAKRTPYQRERLKYWVAKRAEYAARIRALSAAPTPTPTPVGYRANGACWDADCFPTNQDVWQFTTALGQYTIHYPFQRPGGTPVPATGKPVYVLIPGGPLAPGTSGLAGMEWHVAQRGGIAFRADYRSQRQYNGGSPQAFEDVACAIRGARVEARKYGGDPNNVTLIAHSFGGFIAWNVILGNFPPGPECKYQGGENWRPDQYVSASAINCTTCTLPDGTIVGVSPYFVTSDYPHSVDIRAAIKAAPSHLRIPVLVVWGESDIVARLNQTSPWLYDDLVAAGWWARRIPVPGDHSSMLFADEHLDWVTGGRP